MKRREFIREAAIAAGAIALAPATGFMNVEAKAKYASDRIALGKTGITVSRLAIGTGTSGFGYHSDQSESLGISGLADLLKAAHEHGINFWDSADAYGTHPHLRAALKLISREKVVILTKTEASTKEEMQADLDRFRKEIGTDYIDIVLLHMMTDSDWPTGKAGAMEVLSRARESGIVRAHGVSCHTLRALETAASSSWVQIDLARINPAGAIMDADASTVVHHLRRMHDDGKGVIGMKIFGSGQLVHRRDECLRYVLSLPCVDAFTIGQRGQSEMLDLVKRIPDVSVAS